MYHFINTALLTFAPFFIIYTSTRLAERNAFKAACWGAGGKTRGAIHAFARAASRFCSGSIPSTQTPHCSLLAAHATNPA
jgi:hypothetical protein